MGITSTFAQADDAIVVSHDAARPFVTTRIIQENIRCVEEGYAADTVIKATDTIVRSMDGNHATEIPDRQFLYQGQTPQSFRLKTFMTIYETLDADYLARVTDAARILIEHSCPVRLVEGESSNIKITTDYDLTFARFLAES